jgi:hypothetical protein
MGRNSLTFDARVARVTSEFILLTVGTAEDVVSDDVESKNGTKFDPAEITGVVHQIASLKCIIHGEPTVKTKSKHITKAIWKENESLLAL